MKRLMPRALVVLTVLVVLSAGGYAGQVWWARRIAGRWYDRIPSWETFTSRGTAVYASDWRNRPWYGYYEHHLDGWWVPSRTYREFLVLLTAHDLGNDPDAWEAWFKAHPNLVWDEKQKRLVDAKAGMAP